MGHKEWTNNDGGFDKSIDLINIGVDLTFMFIYCTTTMVIFY